MLKYNTGGWGEAGHETVLFNMNSITWEKAGGGEANTDGGYIWRVWVSFIFFLYFPKSS